VRDYGMEEAECQWAFKSSLMINTNYTSHIQTVKVKMSRYTPWRHMGEEKV
jgi:hypothetical protein